jgi:uncharacterized protein GlcG (DUF336 family)
VTLPFQDARTLADGARARALELGKGLSIAVVDYGGFVVLIERMDGVRPMTPDIALSKAALSFTRPPARRSLRRQPWPATSAITSTATGAWSGHPGWWPPGLVVTPWPF